MNDSLYFRLVLLTVFAGALLAVFDPANRSASVAANPPVQPAATLAPTAQPAPAASYHLASSN